MSQGFTPPRPPVTVRMPPLCFWTTPKGTRQGAHEALTDVELITIRLGAMGEFEGV
jgi:hypothetical protein